MFQIMWLVSAVLFVCYAFRRYRVPRFTTQKFSRRCEYLKKAAVAPLKVPWNVDYQDYNPLGAIKDTGFWWFYLTRIDGCTRFLIEISPFTFSKVPFNPFGRTGVSGKGVFPHYGPNNMVLTIVWSRSLGFLKIIFKKKGNILYTGYVDHPLNTDNAWIEANIYYYELQEYPGLKEDCPEWLTAFVKDVECKILNT